MKILVRIIFWLSGVALLNTLPLSANAAGECSRPYTFNMVGPASIEIDPSFPDGKTIWEGRLYVTNPAVVGSCPGGKFTISHQGTGTPFNYTWYETGVKGIVYRLMWDHLLSCSNAWWPMTCTNPGNIPWPSGVATGSSSSMLVVLAKNGEISAGTIAGQFGSATINGTNFALFKWQTPIIVKPSVPTCSVSTSSVLVRMEPVSLKNFSTIGSGGPVTKFTIALRCAGAVGSGTVNAHATLTDRTNVSNRSGVLSLTKDSTATGVGIEVNYQSVVVRFGPDSSAIGNTNQWLAGAASNGVFNIVMGARYVMTESTVTPGTANGRATITMSYQ